MPGKLEDVHVRDKVRLITGPFTGQRARVEEVLSREVRVRLNATQAVLTVSPQDFANFSAAARKAWKTRPARSVGRPRGSLTSRRSVTLRIERSIWDRFVRLERQRSIADRSAFIEQALDEKLGQLEDNLAKETNN